MKRLLCIGVVAIAVSATLAVCSMTASAESNDDQPSNIHGWKPPADDSHHGWGAPRPGDPETGRMTEHGWVAPRDKDCSLNHVDIQGSAQVRCMK